MKNVSTLVLGVVFVGSISSCFGDTLAEGKSALENKMYDKAAALLEKSCEAGNPQGCFTLGALYEKRGWCGTKQIQSRCVVYSSVQRRRGPGM